MSVKLLTFKCGRTGNKKAFNPMFVTNISEEVNSLGEIIIRIMFDPEPWLITYDYEDAVRRWKEALD